MTTDQLKDFMNRHGLLPDTLASLLGITEPAVYHWLDGRRSISKTVSRLLRLFDRKPELMKEFNG